MDFLAELAEFLFSIVGYFTARLLLPIVSLGRFRAQLLRDVRKTDEKSTWSCWRSAGGTIVVGDDLASCFGVLAWLLVLGVYFLDVKWKSGSL